MTTTAASPAGGIEVRSIDYVPETERHGKVWHQGPFWFCGNFQPYTVALGFIGPAMGLSLGWTSLASALGVLFGTFFMAFHASQGPWLGLPQMVQSRAQLGYRGVVVALAGTLFTYVGFNVIDTVIVDNGLNAVFGWSKPVVGLVITVVAAVLAVYGYDWMHRAFQVLFWISLPLWLVLTVAVLAGGAGGKAPAAGGFTWVAFMVQFAVAASYNITYAPYVSDYSRYLPRRTRTSHIVWSVFFGASASPLWLIPIGAWMATRLGVSDPLVGIHDAGENVVTGLGGVLTVVSVLVLVATMGLNAYSGMLTVVTAVDTVRPVTPTRSIRIVTVLVLAVVSAFVGMVLITDFSTAFTNAQLIMLYVLVPWTAVNLVDYFFVRRGHYAITHLFRKDGIYGMWAWRGLVSYLAGLAAMVPFVVLSFFTGPVAAAIGGVDVAFAVGLVVAGGVYLALCRTLDVASEESVVEASERELVSL
ncbi:purine-cytosine permease family protein [Microbispora sp. ATCC PTA-5024]|uniref:purine-cytosine permease family protein n=1 Tax=Microbispora sp. ATCC PTA-5024 TaxID=316330 RepID=UPI0003DC3C58|nr:cytosine permease [Microbispora sp. ATCC PTA-5024]ETK33998.1 allantoin permease [Microbispora sp. ATCC PTA-5024]